MVIINSTKSITDTKPVKTISSKATGVKFQSVQHIADNNQATELSDVPEVNPFLFLQKIDEYKESQQNLKESGEQILRCLRDIQFGLINNEFSVELMSNLKNTLERNRKKFKFAELQEVIDDIIIRAEIELTKLELNHIQPKSIF